MTRRPAAELGWSGTAVCFLVAAAEGVSLTSFGLAAADMSAELGLGEASIGYLASATLIGLTFGALAGGRLGDTFGPKRILAFAVGGFGLFSIGTALSTSFGALFAMRLLNGLLLGGAMPNVIAVAAGGRTDTQVSRVTLVVSGSPIGGVITGLFGMASWAAAWQAIFVVAGAAALLLTPLVILWLPEQRPSQRHAPELRSGIDSAIRGLFARGRRLRTALLWTASFATQLILYALFNWLPALMRGSGLDRRQAGLAFVLLNLGGALGGIIFGQLMRASGRWRVPMAAYAGTFMGLGALALADTQLSVAYLGAGLVGTCAIGAQLLLFGLAPQQYGAAERGTGVGSMTALGRAGSVFGPLIAGWLLGAGFSPGSVLLALLPIVIVAGVAATTLAAYPPVG